MTADAPPVPTDTPTGSAHAEPRSAPAAAHRRRKGKGLKPRHVPQRTCIITRHTGDKRKLIRLVRTPEGRVEVDATGKRNGRGAYLSADRAVWEKALGSNALARALKTEITPEDVAALRAYAETLPTDPTLVALLTTTGRPSRSPATSAGVSDER